MKTCPVCGIGLEENSHQLVSAPVLSLLEDRAKTMNLRQQQILEYSLISILMSSTECEDMQKHFAILSVTADVENGLY